MRRNTYGDEQRQAEAHGGTWATAGHRRRSRASQLSTHHLQLSITGRIFDAAVDKSCHAVWSLPSATCQVGQHNVTNKTHAALRCGPVTVRRTAGYLQTMTKELSETVCHDFEVPFSYSLPRWPSLPPERLAHSDGCSSYVTGDSAARTKARSVHSTATSPDNLSVLRSPPLVRAC